ncbi:DUF6783 domain-containing protein [Blautia producta]|uniref:DUF6783 domain-containing protein n=1 Tax=Blautia producta TaxID=33035 RepID=UPI002A803BF5|nr:DUF6783 domain-containing protein [Blautia coccoides]
MPFGRLCVTYCGRFDSDEGGAASCGDRIGAKYSRGSFLFRMPLVLFPHFMYNKWGIWKS